MTHQEAAAYRMPFGKHRGKRLDMIGATAEGIKYLEWMRSTRGGVNEVDTALNAYLDHPSVAARVTSDETEEGVQQ